MIIDQGHIDLANSYRHKEMPPKFMTLELEMIWNIYHEQHWPSNCWCEAGSRIAFHQEFYKWLDETLQQTNE